MRRMKFVTIPLFLLATACDTSVVLGPPATAGDVPSTSVSVDSTTAGTPEAAAESAEGGIMMGSGT